ncbi:NAD(P)/FAD-dependent oxidoreductase [Paenibacillus sp. y28]|uniref:NAD(P)/FAD-dependent oxidoreductase n=1 Tax=Paenibacillus sp. y28 TaxID=3129110 RepID=UPI003017F457
MQLLTGDTYWPTTLTKPVEYPRLNQDIRTDVLIVGGGMSGALISHMLTKNGVDVTLLEKNGLAEGSSSANTGLLQFSNDMMLCDMIDAIGEEAAVTFYRCCADSVRQLQEIAAGLPFSADLFPRSSLYYASTKPEVPKLRREYETLKAHGFAVEWLEEEAIAARLPFRKAAALLTHGDAEVNPYRFVIGLLEQARDQGARIYEHSQVKHREKKDARFIVHTDQAQIEARRIIYATGYEPPHLGRLIKPNLNRSYAIATKPVPSLDSWQQRWMIWETARPYLYLRTTKDNRVIVGGLDEEEAWPEQGSGERRQHARKLREKAQELFPDLPLEVEFAWSATFGESLDGLPFIGCLPEEPDVFYCLGYGGNGTVYSQIAASIMLAALRNEAHPAAYTVRLGR